MEADEDLTNRLRDVFDLCDTEGKGFISVDYFIDLAKEHFGSGDWNSSQEAINEIASVLDSDGNGQINFEDFCRGVRHMQGPLTPSAIPDDDEGGERGRGGGAFTYSKPQLDTGSEAFEVKSQLVSRDDDRFNNYERSSDCLPSYLTESHACLRLGSSEDDVDSGFSNKSNDHFDHNDCWSESTEREVTQLSYEGDDVIDETGTLVFDHSQSTSNPDSKFDATLPYCGHLGSAKRQTPSAIASHLFRGNSSLNTSRRSSISDGLFEEMDGSVVGLNDKIGRLEEQIRELSETQVRNDEKYLRMKEENIILVERIHLLEEQLREIEQRSQEQLVEEQKNHREVLAKTEKENSREIEILSLSLQHIEREYSQLQEEVPALRSENDRLRRETFQTEKEVARLNQQLSELSEDHAALQEHVHNEQTKKSQEHKVHTQLINELSKELEELRLFKADAHLHASPNLSKGLPRSARKEMESQINRLKQENRAIREESEDLRAQLLNRDVQEGRSLLKQMEMSLASEFENLPRDELMKAIKKEQEDNKKLRDYVDQITLRILDKNPSILEVGNKKK